MLSLVDATPVELRAIADFYENPDRIDDLLELELAPIVEHGSPDKFIGFSRIDKDMTITDTDSGEVVGYVVKED